MKKTMLLLFLIFGVKSAFSKCASAGMEFFPSTQEISLNSMFMIQGYGQSQETINSFKNRTIYLESDNGELIELQLQELLEGQMRLSQAIFCPVSELKPNTTYTLKYTGQTEEEEREMTDYNGEKVYWKTTEEKTIASLNSKMSIKLDKTDFERYGCGPSVNAIFKIKNKSKSEVWYKTEVVEIETNNKAVYYIKDINGKLNVGHNMCAGAFIYTRRGRYKVRFTPMNIDGTYLKSTDWITFKNT